MAVLGGPKGPVNPIDLKSAQFFGLGVDNLELLKSNVFCCECFVAVQTAVPNLGCITAPEIE